VRDEGSLQRGTGLKLFFDLADEGGIRRGAFAIETGVRGAEACLIALRLARAFPAAVRGPVERWALRRFAATRRELAGAARVTSAPRRRVFGFRRFFE